MNYGEFSEIFENFNGELYLYISGSQGVSPAEIKVIYGIDFSTIEELQNLFCKFIDENAYENIDSYLDDCDGDESEAMGEAVNDSGEFLLGVNSNHLTHIFDGGFIEKIERL